jgi:nucleoside-diphosphate-sugar epimerase
MRIDKESVLMNADLPRRVAITGAAGVLGSHLVTRLLAEGCQVHSLDLREMRPAPGQTHHIGDVRDARAVEKVVAGVDALVHCAAALPSYPAAEIRSVIVDGTSQVLRVAHATEVARTVHISSTAVYGLPRIVPTTEDHPREPVDTYSAAKAEAETLAEKYRAEGMCLPIVRPKTFLGPGRMGLFAMLFEWADEGHRFPVLGRGDVRIQMLGLEDLIDAMVTILSAPSEAANDTYNFGAADFGTLRDDFQAVLDAAGHGRQVVSIPARPAVRVLRLLERSRLSPVYGRLLSKLLTDSYVSIDKANRRLGFAPQLSNRDAILRTYDWWQARRAGMAADGPTHGTDNSGGRTSRDPWRQGALGLVKRFF